MKQESFSCGGEYLYIFFFFYFSLVSPNPSHQDEGLKAPRPIEPWACELNTTSYRINHSTAKQ